MDSLPPHLERLDQALADLPDACEAMLLSELDGFLAGVIVSPELVGPGEWLKRIWGGDGEDTLPAFDDLNGVQRFIDLVMRHYNDIVRALDRPGAYAPIFEVDTRHDETLWELWIDGFARAMDLRPQGWQRIVDSGDEDAIAVLAGIAALIAIERGESELDEEEIAAFDAEAPDALGDWVEILHAWRRAHDRVQAAPIARPKVGRNDPCPCGSGRKYKKCCGLN